MIAVVENKAIALDSDDFHRVLYREIEAQGLSGHPRPVNSATLPDKVVVYFEKPFDEELVTKEAWKDFAEKRGWFPTVVTDMNLSRKITFHKIRTRDFITPEDFEKVLGYAYLYHVTDKSNEDSIRTGGLKPRGGKASHDSTYPDRVYVLGDMSMMKYFLQDATDLKGGTLTMSDDIVVVRIALDKLRKGTKFYLDPQTPHGAYFTYTHIPPEAISDISPKSEYLSESTEELLAAFILETLDERTKFSALNQSKWVLDLDGLDLVLTQHGEERLGRHGKPIEKRDVVKAIDAATSDFMSDFANGEIRNNESFTIKARDGHGETLNIVATLNMQPGRDSLHIVTVMRKNDFKTKGENVYEVEVSG